VEDGTPMKKFLLGMLLPILLIVGFSIPALSAPTVTSEGSLSMSYGPELIEEGRLEKDGYYEYTLKGLDTVLAGNEKTAKFEPTILLNKWDGESWIRVSMPDAVSKPSATSLDANAVSWEDTTKEIKMYALQPSECFGAEDGGFEYEIILKEKPLSNIITLNIDASPDLAFYYQPPLTQEEIDAGASRPEHIVGSYAVYSTVKKDHILGQTNYKTGKFCHIYRPKAIDSKGWEVWGELLIEHGVMTVTLPQEFIDKAAYPIYHAAGDTFGYTSAGGSDEEIMGIRGYKATPGSAGTATSITAWAHAWESGKFQAALYKGTALQSPQTEEKDNWSSSTPEPEEVTLNFTNGPSITTDEFVIAIWQEDMAGIYVAYDTVSDAGMCCLGPSYKSWCSTLGSTCCSDYYNYGDNTKWSLYCTYTAGGGCTPDISNTPNSKDFGVVETSQTYTTGLDYFTVTNNSGGAVSITIKAIDFTGGNGWTLSDTATPGATTAGLKAGLEGGDYTIVVKKSSPYNTLKSGLADSATQKWGLKLYAPTSFNDGVQKSTTVTLTATCD